MKTKLLFLLLGALALTACKGSGELQSFIPGIYVDYDNSEYSVVWDTLVVGDFNKVKKTYPIMRKTAFRRLFDGKVGRMEYETEQWLGFWDEENQNIQVLSNAKIIRFYPDSGVLLSNSREYRKLIKD